MSAHQRQHIPVEDLNQYATLVQASRGIVTAREWERNAIYAETHGFPLVAGAFRANAAMAAKLEQEENDAREFLRRLA